MEQIQNQVDFVKNIHQYNWKNSKLHPDSTSLLQQMPHQDHQKCTKAT